VQRAILKRAIVCFGWNRVVMNPRVRDPLHDFGELRAVTGAQHGHAEDRPADQSRSSAVAIMSSVADQPAIGGSAAARFIIVNGV
jgi:hypothetical protein